MKKYVILIIALLVLGACSSPPEDVPKAEEPNEFEGEVKNEISGAAVTDIEVEEGLKAGGMIHGEVPINKEKSSFEFEGYGVGKSHVGTFNDMEGTLTFDKGSIVGAKGVIRAASVESDAEGLTKHLKNADFLDVENYPTIEWESSSIADGKMTGELTLHGITNEIRVPVTVSATGMSAEFLLNLTEFGISYKGVNEEARISFTVKP